MEVAYPGFGTIVVGGERFDHDVVVEAGRVRPRDKTPSRPYAGSGHTPLSADEDIPWAPPTLIVGTGADGRLPILPAVRKEAAARGVDLVAVPTAQACDLLADIEAADAFAILHVTC